MRRETDFVLEKAAWPTMLLEGGGGILRVNQAAKRVLGVADHPAGTLSAIWHDKNTVTADKFLSDHGEGETSQVKLILQGGKDAPFFAHVAKVARDGQNYFLLQLFKESGAAFSELAPTLPPPTKPVEAVPEKIQHVPTALDAAWPALVVDPQGKLIDANAAAARVFGAKAAKGAALTAFCPPEESGALGKLLQQPAQSPPVPLKALLSDGKTAPFRIESCPGSDANYIILQFFKAEEPKPAPKPPEEVFLLQNADWPVLLVQKSGRVSKANHASVQAFGPNIEGDNAQLSTIWSSENKDKAQHFLQEPPSAPVSLKLQAKSGFPEDYTGHFCATVQADVFVLQLIKGVPAIPAKAPEPKTAAPPPPAPVAAPAPPAPSGDTVIKNATEANLAHKQKLDCALQLARSVSLDFNNALTSILGHTSLLLSQAEAGHPWRNSLGEIEKSAAKAAEIANDLAAFSRQEKDVKGQVAGNMNSLLERAMEVFQGTMKQSISITRQLEKKLFTATFDEAKMQQAIVKIFENAVESITGAGKINVLTKNLELSEPTQDRTAKLNAGNYVCVEISDTGAGITDEVMPRIFEPFFTTKGAGHRGLGLAWVYGIVTNHGGGVSVSSTVGTGSVVRLYLPASKKIVRATATADGDLHGKETILLVDDEDLLLTMGQMVLSSFGYTVLTANSGQKALELFTKSKKKIDLVITDLVMPNMSGRELGEQLLKLAPDTRIIWSSGYVRSANEQEQERYLQKPFASQDLLRKVRQVLAQ